MKHQLFKITQGAIVTNDTGAVLILRHPSGKWLLPGGKINTGESWLEALQREIKEETGISSFVVQGPVDIDSWFEGEEGYYVVTFVIEVGEGANEVILSDEHDKYAWVKEEDLNAYDFWHDNIRKRVKDFFDSRKHD